MPAKHPRLTITMRPGLHALLRRLSELTGQSQSALIFELLDGAEPVLSRVVRLIETSNVAREGLKGKLTMDLDAAQKRIEGQLGLALGAAGEDDVEQLLFAPETDSFHHPRAVPGPVRGTSRRVDDPHALTGGSGLTQQLNKRSKAAHK